MRCFRVPFSGARTNHIFGGAASNDDLTMVAGDFLVVHYEVTIFAPDEILLSALE